MMDAGGRDILSLERAEDGKFVKADIFDRTILVERCRQGFFRRTDVGMVLHREGNGTVEDCLLYTSRCV